MIVGRLMRGKLVAATLDDEAGWSAPNLAFAQMLNVGYHPAVITDHHRPPGAAALAAAAEATKLEPELLVINNRPGDVR
jgi:hypothetical protein